VLRTFRPMWRATPDEPRTCCYTSGSPHTCSRSARRPPCALRERRIHELHETGALLPSARGTTVKSQVPTVNPLLVTDRVVPALKTGLLCRRRCSSRTGSRSRTRVLQVARDLPVARRAGDSRHRRRVALQAVFAGLHGR